MDFPTVQRLLVAGATPDASQVLRAKQHALAALATGPKNLGELEAAHRDGEGAAVNFGELQLANMPDDDLVRLLGRDHPQVAGVRSRVAVEFAVAELLNGGLILGLAPAPSVSPNPRFSISVTLGSQMFSRTEEVAIELDRPLLTAQRFAVRSGIDPVQAWRFDATGFLADLDQLALDARTRRCADEAFRSYVRGGYLAAASLLGAVVEGAWYGVGERRRTTHTQLVPLLDNNSTAQLQKELCKYYRTNVKRVWRVDDLERDVVIFRETRNYGVHPRGTSSADVERQFHEDTCGLLITSARSHLVLLAEVDSEAP